MRRNGFIWLFINFRTVSKLSFRHKAKTFVNYQNYHFDVCGFITNYINHLQFFAFGDIYGNNWI